MQVGKHAVVIGGSMAGLLTARVLKNHFDRVTILDRDTYPAGNENRRGVPQGRHTHGLLAGGSRVLEQYLPGITHEFVEAGGVQGDVVKTGRWYQSGGYLAKCDSGLEGVLLSRPVIEAIVRRRVTGLDGVTVHQGCAVDGLVPSADGSAVAGVKAGDQMIAADLTIDTTGRGSHCGDWLVALGFEAPQVEKVEVALAYTTRFFRRDPSALDGDLAVIIPSTPAGKRGGVMLAQEDYRWTVTLFGHFGHAAPSDLEGFLEYARTIPDPAIYETIRSAEPLGEAATARFPASIRRRYERLTRFPDGFLVVGDAICSFNPIYGQGMTAAALQAAELDRAVSSGLNALSRRFFTAASKIIDIPWGIAAGNDLRMPETVGPRSPQVNFINWYIAKLHKAAHHDPALALAFHHVANLLTPPPTLMQPSNLLRVVRGNLLGVSGGKPGSRPMASVAGRN